MLAINTEQTTFVEGSGSWKNFKNSAQFTGVSETLLSDSVHLYLSEKESRTSVRQFSLCMNACMSGALLPAIILLNYYITR